MKCSKCPVEGDKYVLFECDGCTGIFCKECGEYSASEEKCLLSKRKAILLCPPCREEFGSITDLMQNNRKLKMEIEKLCGINKTLQNANKKISEHKKQIEKIMEESENEKRLFYDMYSADKEKVVKNPNGKDEENTMLKTQILELEERIGILESKNIQEQLNLEDQNKKLKLNIEILQKENRKIEYKYKNLTDPEHRSKQPQKIENSNLPMNETRDTNDVKLKSRIFPNDESEIFSQLYERLENKLEEVFDRKLRKMENNFDKKIANLVRIDKPVPKPSYSEITSESSKPKEALIPEEQIVNTQESNSFIDQRDLMDKIIHLSDA